MPVNEEVFNAAKERLKDHPGGENLKMFDSSERAREMQKLGVAKRKKNQARRDALKEFVKDMKSIGEDVSDHAPKGLDMLRFLMVQAMESEDFESAGHYAEKIAQYESPKLTSQQVDMTTNSAADLTDEELEEAIKALDAIDKD